MTSECVGEDDLGRTFDGPEDRFRIRNGDTVARINPLAVHFDRAGCEYGIDVTAGRRLVGEFLTRLQRRTENARVSLDAERAIVTLAGCEDGPIARTVGFRKLLRAPARRLAVPVRFDPDLEDRGRFILEIVLRSDRWRTRTPFSNPVSRACSEAFAWNVPDREAV